MTKYKTIYNANGKPLHHLLKGDKVFFSNGDYKTVQCDNKMPSPSYISACEIAIPVPIRIERPVENCRTEYKREDFHVGDKITWWRRKDPDVSYSGIIKRMDTSVYDFGIIVKYADHIDIIFPFGNGAYDNDVVVTNIKHVGEKNTDDEWEHFANYSKLNKDNSKVKYDDDGLHIYRRKSRPCNLSIDHGYFMLMDCKTHKWHDNTVYQLCAEDGRIFDMSVTPHQEMHLAQLPADTFAVKPDSDILLATINGDM